MKKRLPIRALVSVGLVASMVQSVNAEVIISEIMYNPDSHEAGPPSFGHHAEWVEVFNTGPQAVDISGWTLRDEDGTATNTLPQTTLIAPGEAVVLFSDRIDVSEFQSAWGSGFQAYAIDINSLQGLANSPSPDREILELVDNAGATVDTVNYDDEAPWPLIINPDTDGPSIYLLTGSLSTLGNDDGGNWARSAVGVDGGIQNSVTLHFDGMDIGSPGFVAHEPIRPLLLSLAYDGITHRATIRFTDTGRPYLINIGGDTTAAVETLLVDPANGIMETNAVGELSFQFTDTTTKAVWFWWISSP